MSIWNLGLVLAVNTGQFRTEMRAAAADTKKLGAAQANLHASAQKYQRRQQEAARNLIRGVTYAGAGAALLVKLADAATESQFEIKGLGAVLKMTDGDARDFALRFRLANKEVRNFAPSAVIGRMRALAQAGYNQSQVFENTTAVLRAVNASLGSLSVESATELGINLDRAFGTAGQSMSSLLDMAVQGANKFPMTVNQIAVALGYASEAAVTFGQDAQSVVTAIGLLMPVTKTAAKAGTAYRAMLAAFTKPASLKFFKDMGIAIKDSSGEMRDAFDILADMDESLDKMRKKDAKTGGLATEVLTQKMFGARGKGALAAFRRLQFNTQAEGRYKGRKFADPRAAMEAMRMGFGATEGAAKTLADQMLESSRMIGEALLAAKEEAKIAVGELATPLVNDMKKLATRAFLGIADVVRDQRDNGLVGGGIKAAGYGVAAAIPFLAMGAMKALYSLKHIGSGMRTLQREAQDLGGRNIVRPADPAFRPAAASRWGRYAQRAGAFMGVGQFAPMGQRRVNLTRGAPQFANVERENPLTMRERWASRPKWMRGSGGGNALYRANFDSKIGAFMGGIGNAAMAAGMFYSTLTMYNSAIKDAVNALTEAVDKKINDFLGRSASLRQLIDPVIKNLKAGDVSKVQERDLKMMNARGIRGYYGQVARAAQDGRGVEAGFEDAFNLKRKELLRNFGAESFMDLKSRALTNPDQRYQWEAWQKQEQSFEETMTALKEQLVDVPGAPKGAYASGITAEEMRKNALFDTHYGQRDSKDAYAEGVRSHGTYDKNVEAVAMMAKQYRETRTEKSGLGSYFSFGAQWEVTKADLAYREAIRAKDGGTAGWTDDLWARSQADIEAAQVGSAYRGPISIQGGGYAANAKEVLIAVARIDKLTEAMTGLKGSLEKAVSNGMTLTPPELQ